MVKRRTSERYIELLEQKIHNLNTFIASQQVHNSVLTEYELNPVKKLREMRE